MKTYLKYIINLFNYFNILNLNFGYHFQYLLGVIHNLIYIRNLNCSYYEFTRYFLYLIHCYNLHHCYYYAYAHFIGQVNDHVHDHDHDCDYDHDHDAKF